MPNKLVEIDTVCYLIYWMVVNFQRTFLSFEKVLKMEIF